MCVQNLERNILQYFSWKDYNVSTQNRLFFSNKPAEVQIQWKMKWQCNHMKKQKAPVPNTHALWYQSTKLKPAQAYWSFSFQQQITVHIDLWPFTQYNQYLMKSMKNAFGATSSTYSSPNSSETTRRIVLSIHARSIGLVNLSQIECA